MLGINVPLINVIDDFPPTIHRLGGKCVLDLLEVEPETDLGAQDLLGTRNRPNPLGNWKGQTQCDITPSGRKMMGLLNPISDSPSLSANHPMGGGKWDCTDSRAGHNLLRSWPP